MVNKNLVVSLVLASIFGAALIWLGIYYLHRYLHLRCLELDHWFHTLVPARWRSPCQHCRGTGLGFDEDKGNSRSRSSHRRERRHPSRGRIQAGENLEWNAQQQVQQPRAVLRVQWPEVEQQQMPWIQGQDQADMHRGGAGYPPAVYTPMYPQAYPQGFRRTSYPVEQTATPQQLETAPSIRTHQKRNRRMFEEATVQSQSEASQSEQKPAQRGPPKVRKTDYIHIVDYYPPIIQEAIVESVPAKKPSPSTSSSSTSTEPVEEIRRASIPRAPPRSASFGPPRFNNPIWDPPKPYARQ